MRATAFQKLHEGLESRPCLPNTQKKNGNPGTATEDGDKDDCEPKHVVVAMPS